MFGPTLVKKITKLSDISLSFTTISFIFFSEVGTKQFLFLNDAIHLFPCKIFKELDLLFKVITIVFLFRKNNFFFYISNLFKGKVDFRFDNWVFGSTKLSKKFISHFHFFTNIKCYPW